MALCAVDGYDVCTGSWTDVEGETVSKDRFEEDLVGKWSPDDRSTSGEVEGYEDVGTSDGGLFDEEEWGGYIWRTFSIKRDGRSV